MLYQNSCYSGVSLYLDFDLQVGESVQLLCCQSVQYSLQSGVNMGQALTSWLLVRLHHLLDEGLQHGKLPDMGQLAPSLLFNLKLESSKELPIIKGCENIIWKCL